MPKKYIVLDRDGVINVDLFDYVLKNEDFEFENGSLEAILKLCENNFASLIYFFDDFDKIKGETTQNSNNLEVLR